MPDARPAAAEEVDYPDDTVLVSRTDLDGRIAFVNAAFVAVGGYTEEELIGATHDTVRHPDMPDALFENLWHTVRRDAPWEALIKNRTENGGFYWVRANVMPWIENGSRVGYVWVRTCSRALCRTNVLPRSRDRSAAIERWRPGRRAQILMAG